MNGPERISPDCRKAVREAFKKFTAEVESCGYTTQSQWTYLYHTECFLRWLDYDFIPGEKLKR